MMLWIFFGLNFISKLYGYSNGNFPEVCESMRPRHGPDGAESLPQTSESPFMVSYQLGSNFGDPITVFLESKAGFTFLGFMLETRDLSLNGDSPPLGKFILLDTRHSRLLKCGSSEGSAVSNRLNVPISSTKVNWTAEGEEQDIIFRATFSETYFSYWERVNVTVRKPTSTPEPKTTTAAAITATTQISTTKEVITMQIYTTPSIPNAANTTEPVDILLMCLNSAFVEMKMQIPNIIMAVHPKTSFRHYLCKNSRIVGSSFSVSFSLLTFIVMYIYNSLKDIFIGPVSVVLVISFTEWVIAMLPFGPSHELNEPCECALRVCFPFHHIFTSVFLYVRVNSLFDEWGETRKMFWPLIVHTVLIALTIVWDFVLCASKRTLLQKVKDKAKHNQGHQEIKERLSSKGIFITLISVALMVLITSLSVVIIVELFLMQKS